MGFIYSPWLFLAFCALPNLSTSKTSYQIINPEQTSDNISSIIPPKISAIRVGNEWENITDKFNSSLNGSQYLHSEKGDDLLLSCTAPYPIKWNIQGIIAPPEIVSMGSPKRNLADNTFEIQVYMYFVSSKSLPYLVASAGISCEKIQNPEVKDQWAIFVTGNTDHTLLAPLKSSLQSGPTLIPCPTSNPIKDKPILYFRGHESTLQLEIQDVLYNPTLGFQYKDSSSLPGGIYTCVTSSHVVMFNVSDLYTPDLEYGFSPKLDKITKFSDESIEIKCLSHSFTVPVQIEIEDGNKTEIKFVQNLDNYKIVRISKKKTNNDSETESVVSGTVVCKTEDDEIIKEWNWELVEPPNLYLDNLSGEINCLSPLPTILANSVRCKDNMFCNFMAKTCIDKPNICNFGTRKYFPGDYDGVCWVEELQKSFPCSALPFYHLNGVVSCGVMGLRKFWEFFISLDSKRYVNWQEAPLRELIKIEEIEVGDGNDGQLNSTLFVCRASAYLFADSLSFKLKFRNESESILQLNQTSDSSLEHFKVTSGVTEVYVTTFVDKSMIPEDVTEICCLAPFWNSTDILEATKYLEQSCI